jgi:predicted dehydrogenase
MIRVRIGTLGAARITPSALIKPAKLVPGVEVAAVAARDRLRADSFAAKHGIPVVHESYEALIADSSIDAVYNPLPNARHAEWTLRALEAGKHVLCEKPLASNESEARSVAEAADKHGLVVMEAFHYRYHPLADRMVSIVGELGEIKHIETWLCFPLPRFSDIRYSLPLSGGALMDAGCYAVHLARLLGGGEPTVRAARALLRSPGVDRAMSASLEFPSGAIGRVNASLWSSQLLRISARVVGSRGQMRVFNFIAPQAFHRLSYTVDGVTKRERVAGEATYTYQLRAFKSAVETGEGNLTPPSDSIANMAVIDEIYRKAGLVPRGTI